MTGRHNISILLALAVAISCATCAWARGSVTARTMLNESGTKYTETVTYYDGLGRPVQTLTKGLNTGNVPVLNATKLNPDGSASRQWLPFGASGITGRVADANIAALSKASLSDSHAYSDMTYDALGRVVRTSTSGDAWHSASKGVSVTHSSNAANSVRKYLADASGSGISRVGYWAACSLRSEKTTDEDGLTVEVFTDFSGRTVLERRGGDHDTYYVYNRAGQLRFVLQPMYEEDQDIGLYAFEYRYDQYGDLVYKAIPGGGYTQYWYDLSHRMTFMQDANLRAKNLYRFFLYDKLGRQTIQGVAGSCTPSRTVNSASYTGGSDGFMSTGYTLTNASQIQQVTLESVSYYDTYSFASSLSQDLVKGGTANATGKLTGSIVYASDGSKSMSAIYYDIKGNVIETRELTNFGTKRITSGTFTFTGQPLKTTMTEGSVTLITENTYDASSGLLTATDVTINGTKQRVSAVTYDDLGRIASVIRGAEQKSGGKVSYTYNLHGKTKSITGPGFSQNLYYVDWTGTKLYNGSVSAMTWTMGSGTARRGYKYSYNDYGWLTSADYGESNTLTANKDRYSEKFTAFTRNGGITKLQRNGLKADGTYGKVDDLTLGYTGNRVMGISDLAPVVTQNGSMDYPGGNTSKALTYNSFGALTSDPGRGITSIGYDNFGNPTKIQYTGSRSSSNVYSSTGEKIKTVHVTGLATQNTAALFDEGTYSIQADDMNIVGASGQSTIEYHGNIIYRNSKVDMVLFPGGYATINGTAVTFHYYTQDYLGNNRAVINGSTGAIEQTVAYYPYGAVIADLGTPTTGQPYKFGGKELITSNGLNEYDFGARQYYSAVPAFTRIDPMAESFPHLSPYLFCGNDPVNKVDPSGMEFTEASKKYINKFTSNIESRIKNNNKKIDEINAKLNKSGINSKKADKLQKEKLKSEGSNASLEEVKTEIAVLQESTQVYNIYKDDSMNISGDPYGYGAETRGGVKYNENTDMFDIMLGDDSLGLLAHELKHAYQFEMGDYSSGFNTTGLPFYDQTDELEAYERGALFGQPKNHNFQSMYGQFQKAASGVRHQNETIQKSNRALRNIANATKSTFRWNGVTYKHK